MNLPAQPHCPRCQSILKKSAVGETMGLNCPSCLGVFLTRKGFEAEVEARARLHPAHEKPPVHQDQHGPAELKCPACQQVMTARNHGRASGVVIDICATHGMWLDRGELGKISAFVAASGNTYGLASPKASPEPSTDSEQASFLGALGSTIGSAVDFGDLVDILFDW